MVGLELDGERVQRAIHETSRRTNKHPDGPDYDWDTLPDIPETEQLYEQAKRYGY